MFDAGRWPDLLQASRSSSTVGRSPRRATTPEQALAERTQNAERLIENGELSHASRMLCSNGVAPGDANTLAQLRDPALRPAEQVRPLPHHVRHVVLDRDVELDRKY